MHWLKNKGGEQKHIFHSGNKSVFSKGVLQSSMQPSAYAMLLDSEKFLSSLETCGMISDNEFTSIKRELEKKSNQKKLFAFLRETIIHVATKKYDLSGEISNAYLKIACELVMQKNRIMKKFLQRNPAQGQAETKAMFQSIENSRLENFLSCIWRGADLNEKNEKGKNALELINEKGNITFEKIAKCL